MNQKQDEYHALIRSLKQRWDGEDAARDERERRAKEIFLEDQANQIFAPIEHAQVLPSGIDLHRCANGVKLRASISSAKLSRRLWEQRKKAKRRAARFRSR